MATKVDSSILLENKWRGIGGSPRANAVYQDDGNRNVDSAFLDRPSIATSGA
jgi:hypothetical protein